MTDNLAFPDTVEISTRSVEGQKSSREDTEIPAPRQGGQISTPAGWVANKSATCEHCGEPFTPRQHTGGKPQLYCGEPCRRAADNARQSQRGQRGAQRGEEPAPDSGRALGTLLENGGGETLLVAEDELRRVDAMKDDKADDFDWSDDGSVILHRQPETAIYRNPYGHVVIRQADWPDEDAVVTISPENLQAVIDHLCDMAGIPSAGGP